MSTQLEIVPADSRAVATRQNDPGDMLRMALEKGASVDVIERLMAVRREIQAEQAKAAFDEALADFQSECPIIVKEKFGAKQAYKYAPLDAIVSQTRDLIRKHGFSFSLTSDITDGWVLAKCSIKHRAGHTEVSEFKAPIDTKNPMMSEPQRYGGAMTFAKRYAFVNGFGILTSDEDIDGASAKPKPRGPSALEADESALRAVAQDLWNLLKPIRGAEQNWVTANKFLWKTGCLKEEEEAPLLSASRFREVIAAAKKHLAE